MFQDELKMKDEDYTKLLKQQNADIDEIIAKMRSQFKHLRSLYAYQLEEIEREFLADVLKLSLLLLMSVNIWNREKSRCIRIKMKLKR